MAQNKKGAASEPGWIFSAPAVAEFFGVAERTIRQWSASEGMPKATHGKYNLLDCFAWWNENINKPVSDTDASARERQSLAKAEILEYQLKEMKGELFPLKDYDEAWTNRAYELRQSLESAEFVLAPMLVDIPSESEAAEIISKFFRRVLDSYCREGRFTRIVAEDKPEAPAPISKPKKKITDKKTAKKTTNAGRKKK